MQPPVMPEDGHTTRVTSGEDASSPAAGKDTSLLEALWDDEDTRAFYECLPDLRFAVARQSVNPVKKKWCQSLQMHFLIKFDSGYLIYKIC
jgi:regulator of nonsense transcripts 2